MRSQRKARWFVLAAALLVGLFALGTQHDAEAQVQIDPNLETYESVGGVSGNLNSIGSDTLNNLMTLWAEGFRAMYPNVNIQIEGKGSSTAPPALIEGTAQLGPMSRPMKSKELDAFEKKFGYKPTAIKVAIDALAMFVHKDNPIEGLTLQQVDSIFSNTYKRGGQDAKTWADVGLSGTLAGTPFSLYGRNSASGTYGMFKKIALNKGDFKDTVKEQPGSSSVVQGVASDVGGIGYSGIGYKTSGVKAIAVGDKQDELFEPSLDNSLSGDYPLARFLYVYVNKKPNEPLDQLTLEFVKFVLSKDGQNIVVKDGYYPLPAPVATASIDELK
ncbi:MAG: phosphate-binding protein [Candidatus Entotheonella factor]|uniref:Phosphate-binding protein n=1 Tax=Entotheonella factor TaxID=1429438 RepID=W4LIS1_ENTF1|nr:phosphate ABC transporter substrate-binding protein PstS family protein [Candidatus Entotheonella palauensis]ETW97620.1 MAG: phosphate-binding protein [Candidatus Entotheonella factor]